MPKIRIAALVVLIALLCNGCSNVVARSYETAPTNGSNRELARYYADLSARAPFSTVSMSYSQTATAYAILDLADAQRGK